MLLSWIALAHAGPVTALEGPRPAKDLHAAASARQAELQACFNGASGEVTLRVRIEPDGLVSNAEYGTDVADPSLPRCLVSEALRMRTPKRPGDTSPSMFEWTVSVATLGEKVPDEAPPPGEFTVKGTIDQAAVRSTLAGNDNQYQYCYRKELIRDPSLAGRLDVHFQIDANGLVQSATVHNSTIGNDRIEECVVNRVRAARYPAPGNGQPVSVAWPVEFTAKD